MYLVEVENDLGEITAASYDRRCATFDFATVTVPVGLLLSTNKTASTEFSQELSGENRTAIQFCARVVHNKAMLKFVKDDLFWPRNVPQL